MQCTAKSKGSGKQCERAAMIGKTKCHMHGGKTPSGKESVHFKGGPLERSKVMPKHLRSSFEAFVDSPGLLDATVSLARFDSRIDYAYSTIDDDESDIPGAMWKGLRKIARQINTSDIQPALVKKMVDIINKGAAKQDILEEIDEMEERKRRIVDTEIKRIVAFKGSWSPLQVMTFWAAMMQIISQEVTNAEERQACGRRLIQLLGRNDQEGTLHSGAIAGAQSNSNNV